MLGEATAEYTHGVCQGHAMDLVVLFRAVDVVVVDEATTVELFRVALRGFAEVLW